MTSARSRHRIQGLRGARVVLVNWRDPWHRLAGGSERYAWEFAVALRDAGAEVEFWTARDRGQSSGEERAGIRVVRRGGQYGFYARTLLALLAARLRRRVPDLVVDMDCGIPVFTPLALSGRTPVVLVVHHVHQEQFRVATRRPISDLGRILEARAMPRLYRTVPTIAVSESTVAEMRDTLGWRSEVRVVHNGVSVDRAALGPLEDDRERVVLLGRLVTHKRVDLTLRALAQVLETRPDLRVDVLGTGPDAAGLGDLVAELGIAGSVRLHGFVPEEDKATLLTGARLHVCASDAEGWGLVVLEAAACGVPTLARDVPGMRDSVRHGETGWLLAEPDGRRTEGLVERLVEGIRESLDLMSDPARRARVERDCRAWAAEFGWERMHAEVVDVVTEALLT